MGHTEQEASQHQDIGNGAQGPGGKSENVHSDICNNYQDRKKGSKKLVQQKVEKKQPVTGAG